MSAEAQQSAPKSPVIRDDHSVLKSRCCGESLPTVERDGVDHPLVVCDGCGDELGSPLSILSHSPPKNGA